MISKCHYSSPFTPLKGLLSKPGNLGGCKIIVYLCACHYVLEVMHVHYTNYLVLFVCNSLINEQIR